MRPQAQPHGYLQQHRGAQVAVAASTWCALQTRSRSCLLRKSVTVSLPKVYETPRSLSPQPCSTAQPRDALWQHLLDSGQRAFIPRPASLLLHGRSAWRVRLCASYASDKRPAVAS